MKKLLLVCSLIVPAFGFAAEWEFVTETSDHDTDHYIDKTYYKYNDKTNTAEIWHQRRSFFGLEEYIEAKTLSVYDCIGKKDRTLAQVTYTYTGDVKQTITTPSPYTIIFPDTIGESLWEAACKTKGKGLYLPYRPNFISKKRMELIMKEQKAP